MIRIQGLWFQKLGVNIGDLVLVKCEDGELIITQDTSKTELVEAEKALMEQEIRKLHEKFLKRMMRQLWAATPVTTGNYIIPSIQRRESHIPQAQSKPSILPLGQSEHSATGGTAC